MSVQSLERPVPTKMCDRHKYESNESDMSVTFNILTPVQHDAVFWGDTCSLCKTHLAQFECKTVSVHSALCEECAITHNSEGGYWKHCKDCSGIDQVVLFHYEDAYTYH